MEVEVTNGNWGQEMFFQVRLGDVLRQAELTRDARIIFPKSTYVSSREVRVDVFERVGSTKVTIERTRGPTELKLDGRGFAGLGLRLCAQELKGRPSSALGGWPTFDKTGASLGNSYGFGKGECVEQNVPGLFGGSGKVAASGSQQRPAPGASTQQGPVSPQSAPGTETREERMAALRKQASEYVERHDLRQVLQDMFQKVIRERPEDPFAFMQTYLTGTSTGRDLDILKEKQREIDGLREKVANLEGMQRELHALRETIASREAASPRERELLAHAEAESKLRAQLELKLQDELVKQREFLTTSLEAARADAEKRQRADLEKHHSRDLEKLRADLEDRHQKELEKQRLEHGGQLERQKAEHGSQLEKQKADNGSHHSTELERHRSESARQLSELEERYKKELESTKKELERQRGDAEGRRGSAKMESESRAALQARLLETQVRASEAEKQARAHEASHATQQARIEALERQLEEAREEARKPQEVTRDITLLQGPDEAAGGHRDATLTGSGRPSSSKSDRGGKSDVKTHMLAQLLASTYAPPVPPTMYVEPRDDAPVEDIETTPEFMVSVTGCKDVLTNGTYAAVSVCNMRPLYRLLGPEPRYLFFAEAGVASGWRIVNRMGSEEFVERFLNPNDAALPVQCDVGELGGRVAQCTLTFDTIGRISMVSSLDEKMAIRKKLNDEYGERFTRLEAAQRGFTSRASPVVAVAHALEAQQRAIQLLHSQLSVETQRREAAEVHATTMEDAFETLQLRIQAQLPGPPATMATLQSLKATKQEKSGEKALKSPAAAAASQPHASHDRELVMMQDGEASWGPDIGPGQGPVPTAPVPPKDRKPVPPPTFRRLSSSVRHMGQGQGPGGAAAHTPSGGVPGPSAGGPGGPGGPSGGGPSAGVPASGADTAAAPAAVPGPESSVAPPEAPPAVAAQ